MELDHEAEVLAVIRHVRPHGVTRHRAEVQLLLGVGEGVLQPSIAVADAAVVVNVSPVDGHWVFLDVM